MTLIEKEELYNAIKRVVYDECLIGDCESYEKFIKELSKILRI